MGSLEGKTAIVTGGASGIGRATALLFAQHGARVVVADLDERGGHETVESITRHGGRGRFVKADVTSADETQRLVEETLRAFGAVHVLHNNAGLIRHRDSIDDVPETEWRFVIDVDLNSVYLGSKAVFPIMRKQGGGVIVNTSSMAAFVPLGVALSYAAAKAGVVSLTRSLAQLGENDNIRVNAVCPSQVDSAFHKAKPAMVQASLDRRIMLQPEYIARAVYYAAAHDSLTGVAIKVQLEEGAARYYETRHFDPPWHPIEGL